MQPASSTKESKPRRGKPMKMYLTPIITFGYGITRGYSPTNHQPYSSNAGWINPGYPM